MDIFRQNIRSRNMGTLIRSCAWFGIRNIALSPQCVDPYNPKAIRAAMGAIF